VKRTLLLTAAALLTQVGATNAAILLIIDVSNPALVKITSTTATSSGSSSLIIAADGITLHNIMKAGANVPNTTVVDPLVATSNLFPTQSPAATGGITSRYTGVMTFDFDSGVGTVGAGNDLSVYQNNGSGVANNQIFTAGQQAFNGESVWDLSAYASVLPNAGTTGDIISGYLPSGTGQGVVLGQYTVIPEPSSLVLGAAAAGGLFLRRRRA
jgi:hypothetical protein